VARKVVLAVLVCVSLMGIVVFSLPQRYLPERLKSQIIVDGVFSGKPVEIAIPGPKVESVRVSLRIRGIAEAGEPQELAGRCLMGFCDESGHVDKQFAGRGYARCRGERAWGQLPS